MNTTTPEAFRADRHRAAAAGWAMLPADTAGNYYLTRAIRPEQLDRFLTVTAGAPRWNDPVTPTAPDSEALALLLLATQAAARGDSKNARRRAVQALKLLQAPRGGAA